jgi:hypothetical protein
METALKRETELKGDYNGEYQEADSRNLENTP